MDMDKLNTFLKKLHEWQRETFPNQNVEGSLHHLKEEVDELLEVIENTELRHQPNTALKRELADCFILLFESADLLGFDLSEVLVTMESKFEVLQTRDYSSVADSLGIVRHVKSTSKCCSNCKGQTPWGCANPSCEGYSEFKLTHNK